MLKKFILSSALCLNLATEAKVILWDLGGVLFEPDKIGVALEVGLQNFISHVFWDLRSPTEIQAKIFDVISHLEFDEHARTDVAGSSHGLALPPIMCRWQAGTITGKEIIARAQSVINKLYRYDYFDSKVQKDLISKCIQAMFDPEILARNIYPAEEGIKLLQESYRMKTEQGAPVHRQFVFSNWDHLSFNLCKKQHGSIFRYFEAIVISGHIKRIKPNQDAFEYLTNTYHLDPQECILIDDQEVNVRAARAYGIQAVLIQNGDYEQLRGDLRQLGVIP
jgi:putative hydrolase of the HAD superfamily